MASKGKGKRGKTNNETTAELDDSKTDVSSEGEKPLLKRDEFICSAGHNAHLKEDYEQNETLLVGRKMGRRRKPRTSASDRQSSVESQSLTSFPSDLTLSSQTSSPSDILPSVTGTLKGPRLQSVPEESVPDSRHYSFGTEPRHLPAVQATYLHRVPVDPRRLQSYSSIPERQGFPDGRNLPYTARDVRGLPFAHSPAYSDLDSPQTPRSGSTSSSKNATPKEARRKIGLLGRFWSSEDSRQASPYREETPKDLDFFDMASRTLPKNSTIVDTYEPYTYIGSPSPVQPRRQLKKQVSTGSLSRDGRLLMPRASVVHPVGPFDEPKEAYDDGGSYATAYDPKTGRPRLIRRDSVIHPPPKFSASFDEGMIARGWAPHRRNSIVRPLQMEMGHGEEGEPNAGVAARKMHKSYSASQGNSSGIPAKPPEMSREEMEKLREASIKKHLSTRRTPVRNASGGPAPVTPDHLPAPKYVNGRFEVPWETQHKPGLFDAIRWKLTSSEKSARVPKDDELRKTLPIVKPNFKEIPENGIRVTWMGHSSVLIQMDNIIILTDPIFSERAAPMWLMGPKRYRRSPCSVNSLPRVDVVLISHNHYDHLDSESVRLLNNRFGENLYWFVPLGLQGWMASIGCVNVYEMSWWEEIRPNNCREVLIAFTPAQHWCKRALTDENKVLWGSWCVITPRYHFFFAGDTGYCEVFKLIGERYGPFDLAAIPIGAYEPRWFMKLQNVNPFEAVLIHEDLFARQSIGIHWGTFALTPEHYLAPRKDLAEALNRRALPPHSFFTLSHGESKLVAASTKPMT